MVVAVLLSLLLLVVLVLVVMVSLLLLGLSLLLLLLLLLLAAVAAVVAAWLSFHVNRCCPPHFPVPTKRALTCDVRHRRRNGLAASCRGGFRVAHFSVMKRSKFDVRGFWEVFVCP